MSTSCKPVSNRLTSGHAAAAHTGNSSCNNQKVHARRNGTEQIPEPCQSALAPARRRYRLTKDSKGDQHRCLPADDVAQTTIDRSEAADGQHAMGQFGAEVV
jgi:hypothetical protein